MKKYLLMFLPLLSLPLLSGCSFDDHPVQLTYGTLIDKSATQITSADFDTMVSNHENFLLACYPKDSTCSCWRAFSSIIDIVVEDYHYKIYKYYAEDIANNSTMQKMGGFIERYDAPTFYIIENGKNYKSYNHSINNPFFKVIENFLEELAKKCRTPKLMEVDEELVDKKILEEEKPVFYFGRKTCSDCNYATPNVITPYFKNNDISNELYFLDLDVYRSDKTIYQEKKDKFLLSEANNEKLGFGTGYVPTLQVYNNGVLKDMTVYFNDGELTYNSETDAYYPSGSYYNETRNQEHHYLEGIEYADLTKVAIKESDTVSYGGSARYWDNEKAAIYHNGILESFLKYYLK